MAFSPQEIGTRTFSRVRTGGVDRVEVADFLAAVARQTQDLQHQLARAHEQIQRLTAEVEAARSDGRGAEEVAQILSITEDAVSRVKARAQADAAATRHDADTYARQVHAEVDALREQAEAEVETYRRQTVEHANRMRAEVETSLAQMRGEAEGAIRRAHAQMSAELGDRADALAAAEQALIDRLHRTAGALHQTIDDLRDRQPDAATGDAADLADAPGRAAVPLVSVPDPDPSAGAFSHLPPPPATGLG